MLNFDAFSVRDKQNVLAMLTIAENEGVVQISELRNSLRHDIAVNASDAKQADKGGWKNPLHVCKMCGGRAIRVLVNTNSGNLIAGGYTHAIQCQNRPQSGNKWKPTHCGHTEYIIEDI